MQKADYFKASGRVVIGRCSHYFYFRHIRGVVIDIAESLGSNDQARTSLLVPEKQRRRMYTLYSMQRSGNSYKVRLAMALLDIPHRVVEVDILTGESRTPDFLAKNPSGQVPLLEVAPGRHLAESNAILWYVGA